MKSETKGVFLLMAVVLLMVVMTVGFACGGWGQDPEGATRVLEANGFTHVQITGYRFFMKGEHDHYSTGFTAIGPTGMPVSGSVTRGWLTKGTTIRFD